MTNIRELRWYAAARHAQKPQEYESGVPYWIHYLICELLAIAFNLDPRTRRVIWGHDIPEDVGDSHDQLRQAGWTSEEVIDIYRLTDEPGKDRADKKSKTLPKTAHGTHYAIGGKVCDRGGNRLFGLLSGSIRKGRRYQHEHPDFRHYLFDPYDTKLLGLWYFVDGLMKLRTHPIGPEEFEQRPLRLLINKWIANKEVILNSDKVDLLPLWHELKALLDAEYKR